MQQSQSNTNQNKAGERSISELPYQHLTAKHEQKSPSCPPTQTNTWVLLSDHQQAAGVAFWRGSGWGYMDITQTTTFLRLHLGWVSKWEPELTPAGSLSSDCKSRLSGKCSWNLQKACLNHAVALSSLAALMHKLSQFHATRKSSPFLLSLFLAPHGHLRTKNMHYGTRENTHFSSSWGYCWNFAHFIAKQKWNSLHQE